MSGLPSHRHHRHHGGATGSKALHPVAVRLSLPFSTSRPSSGLSPSVLTPITWCCCLQHWDLQNANFLVSPAQPGSPWGCPISEAAPVLSAPSLPPCQVLIIIQLHNTGNYCNSPKASRLTRATGGLALRQTEHVLAPKGHPHLLLCNARASLCLLPSSHPVPLVQPCAGLTLLFCFSQQWPWAAASALFLQWHPSSFQRHRWSFASLFSLLHLQLSQGCWCCPW